ncbi:MAG: TRAP transporter small permease [Firmicutes bacterium]|nr:TRAP transporter small permease [Bacillota bacterium]
MIEKLKWLEKNFEELLCAIFMSTTVGLLFFQVVYRYGFGKSVAWTEELSRFAFLALVYFGTSLAAKHGSHIRVTAQFKILPKLSQKYVILLSDLIWLAFNVVVMIEGFKLFNSMAAYPLVSPVMDFNLRWVFLIIPVSFALQSFRIVQRYYNLVKDGTWQALGREGDESSVR